MKPQIILANEPTASLDMENREDHIPAFWNEQEVQHYHPHCSIWNSLIVTIELFILKGRSNMGFFVMIGAMLLGILFIVLGITRRKQKAWPTVLIVLGIVFVLIAVYLGLPK